MPLAEDEAYPCRDRDEEFDRKAVIAKRPRAKDQILGKQKI